MINVASIRAAARATAGDIVGISKAQLDELLLEVEGGQRATRELKLLSTMTSAHARVGIDGVSDHD